MLNFEAIKTKDLIIMTERIVAKISDENVKQMRLIKRSFKKIECERDEAKVRVKLKRLLRKIISQK